MRRLRVPLALGLAFAAFAAATAAGLLAEPDRVLAREVGGLWRPELGPLFWGIAVLGGLEVTGLVTLALAALLLRGGPRGEALVVLAYPAAVGVEALCKRLLARPEMPAELFHGRALSVSGLVAGTGGSFPAGHGARAVVVYGLVAMVLGRRWRPVRAALVAGAVALAALIASDRLYVGAHWATDVVGGLLLGATLLTAAAALRERHDARGGRRSGDASTPCDALSR